jgi:hypothetical protein
MEYPTHFPKSSAFDPHNPALKGWEFSWKEPLGATNKALADLLLAEAQSQEMESGFCQRTFAMREAAHRLRQIPTINQPQENPYP